MFRTLKDFEKTYLSEKKFTLSHLEALTDSSLSQAVNNDHRTIGRLAWHICETYPEMLNGVGLTFDSINPAVPTVVSEFVETYKKYSTELLNQIKEKWTDETLLTSDNLYGEDWLRGSTLLIFINHEIHHRGQMSVLMRQAGIIVPAMYGPAKEGWKEYKKEPPTI